MTTLVEYSDVVEDTDPAFDFKAISYLPDSINEQFDLDVVNSWWDRDVDVYYV